MSSDTNQSNTAAYSSDEAVETYRENAVTDGLFPHEAEVFETYFSEPGRVLDLGCGAGRTTVELHRQGHDVIGVDISEGMVEAAREQFPALTVEVGDATDLRFDDDAFDHVLFSYCGLDYVYPERARHEALREVHRVLAPGGYFAFSTHNCLYNVPALLDDWGHIRNFYLDGGNWRRLFGRYKHDTREYDTVTHVTHPLRQRRELDGNGFEFVAYHGKRDSPLQYFERRPYYVARTPEAATQFQKA